MDVQLSAESWPWLALAALGFFHGLNPAMGWLFAVGLGLQRRSRRAVVLSLVPIALGHAAAVALAIAVFLMAGLTLDRPALTRAAGLILIAWAAWHALWGHRQRVRIGMQTGLAGLAAWSFLVANAHGAGLMLLPFLIPLCAAPGQSGALSIGASTPVAITALGVHTSAMLAAIAGASLIVYDWVGVGFLRRGWVNLDLIWVAALALCGLVLLLL